MTVETLYHELLEHPKNPDRALYDTYRKKVGSHIEERIDAENPADPGELLPLNFEERIKYIDSRPYQYHSIVQLKNLYEEFEKRAASYRVRRKNNPGSLK